MGFACGARYALGRSYSLNYGVSMPWQSVEATTVDELHFDALTRTLARGVPRRAALGALVGAVLTGAVLSRQPTSVKAKKKHKDKDDCEHFEGVCNERGDCCTKKGLVCINRVCLNCIPHNGSCNSNAPWGDECCNGFSCVDFSCVKDDDVECEGRGCKKKRKKKKKH
jgi:hypothetical protein